jgi:leucyl-tRNA synthetase
MAEVKQVTGCFTGCFAIHPLTHNPVPIWISEYVLAGYGTGAIMGVPSGDQRDHAFAKHFEIPITNIFGQNYTGEAAYADKTGALDNSDFLSGIEINKASEIAIRAIVDAGSGKHKINYKLRDAGFSRQRYWGEPFPIIYIGEIPYAIDEPELDAYPELQKLPLELPQVDDYKAGPEGQGPLANIDEWVNTPAGRRETNTMPGYAGSSWYFLRYMDPHNDEAFASRAATDYWRQVDVYVGGTEHAVGHLLYSRMWTKALYDLGHITFQEPFRKLINQGMIQGSSRFVYRVRGTNTFVSYGLKDQHETDKLHVDVSLVDGLELDTEGFKKWRPSFADAQFILEDGKYLCGAEVEKMSKGKYNVVNPDDIVNQYGADTFRMYEMFLGPLDVSKPWDTKGIEGVHRFLKKLWRLFHDEQKGWIVNEEAAIEAELRIIHKTIKKTEEDIERFAFNTAVSQFMICVNELSALDCHKRDVLEALTVLICSFAPHMAEELWHGFGHESSVVTAIFPKYEDKYVIENTKKYPIAVNGKTRAEMEFPLDAEQAVVEKEVLADETIKKWLDGKEPKKFIYVKGKMINVVV